MKKKIEHSVIPLHVQDVFDKIKHYKSLAEFRDTRYIHIIKKIYRKIIANIKLNVEKLQVIIIKDCYREKQYQEKKTCH